MKKIYKWLAAKWHKPKGNETLGDSIAIKIDYNKRTKTYDTVKFRCLGCRRFATFGASGLCQMCLEDTCSRESNGG